SVSVREADRTVVAQLHGEAMHHVRWRELTAAGHDAAVTALRDLATGRALLLAELAGILERASEVCRQAAQLCRDAGAGREAIPRMDGGGAAAGGLPRACCGSRGGMHARGAVSP